MHAALACTGVGMMSAGMSAGMMGGWGWWPVALLIQVGFWGLVIWLTVRLLGPLLRKSDG